LHKCSPRLKVFLALLFQVIKDNLPDTRSIQSILIDSGRFTKRDQRPPAGLGYLVLE
jgi:hypothetical protein